MQAHTSKTLAGDDFLAAPADPEATAAAPEWLDRVRDSIDAAGQYLAYEEDGEPVVHELTREWTRIGRSLAADVRFDDPTVSRRHALVARRADGVRVLDDRSLNGVFVNGERVEWHALRDGDELVVGKHRLRFLDVPAVSGTREFSALDAPRPLLDAPQPA